MLGLADFNPDGLAILQQFRHGSVRTSVEGRFAARVRWLGLRSRAVLAHAELGLQGEPLSRRDEAVLRGLEGRLGADVRYKEEMVMMRRLGKFELQWLYGNGAGYVGRWVERAILRGEYL